MRRIVADTNIYISAFNFGGLPYQVLIAARARRIQLCASPYIFGEIHRTLRRKFYWSDARIADVLNEIARFTIIVEPYEQIDAVEKDDSDNRILECALAAEAEIVVTGDLT